MKKELKLLIWISFLTLCAESKGSVHDTLYRLEQDLDRIRSFSADFKQTNPNGTIFEGKVFLKRPGKIRFSYSTPAQMLIVADGNNLIYFDPATHQVSYLPLEGSPAKLLLDDFLDFRAHASIISFEHQGKTAIISLKTHRTRHHVTFFIDMKEKVLNGWITKDPEGHKVSITFSNIKKNPDLQDPALFEFKKPKRSKRT